MKLRNYIHNLPSLKGSLIYVDGINLDVELTVSTFDHLLDPRINYPALSVARNPRPICANFPAFSMIMEVE